MKRLPPILQVGDVLIASDILTEMFCCDLAVCRGACCIEGDAGAPVTVEETGLIEECLDTVWPRLSASAQSVIDRQGVAYVDEEGDLVTSIVGGRDCVFTYYDDLTLDGADHPSTVSDCCLCALEEACRRGATRFEKPISCALYPIRAKEFDGGYTGLNYSRWAICEAGRDKGRRLGLPLYRFLERPLVRRFGQPWYDELCQVARELLTDQEADGAQ